MFKNKLIHFAIHTDDMERAKDFYGKVFNWGFHSYGSPGFSQIKDTEDDELFGALQARSYSALEKKVRGFECTISVENVDYTIEKVVEAGGSVLMSKTAIPGVGWIAKFSDTEGNLVCAMEDNQNAK